MNPYDLVGYAASALILISMSLGNIIRLRVFNLLGAALFTVYGVLVQAWPVAVLNAIVVGVNLVHIQRLRAREDAFELLEIRSAQSDFLARFIDRNAEDIRRFFPRFDLRTIHDPVIVLILRELRPVGLFVAEREGEDTLRVHLDYVIPEYRDLKSARYFYRNWRPSLRGAVRRLIAHTDVATHRDYLRKVGFVADRAHGDGWFVRDVPADAPPLASALSPRR